MKVSYDGNTDFAIGSLVTVRIPLSQKEIFEVPISSVINIDGVDYVFYVEQDGGKDVAKLCTVTLGNIDGNNVEVSGVENGMRIIKDGVKNVTENQEVTVVGE
jgi:multidrug efflux pump subunit AcrA (membrane-fusion protein)